MKKAFSTPAFCAICHTAVLSLPPENEQLIVGLRLKFWRISRTAVRSMFFKWKAFLETASTQVGFGSCFAGSTAPSSLIFRLSPLRIPVPYLDL